MFQLYGIYMKKKNNQLFQTYLNLVAISTFYIISFNCTTIYSIILFLILKTTKPNYVLHRTLIFFVTFQTLGWIQ